MNQQNRRLRQLKIALLSLFAAAALLASPRLAQRVYAQETTCSANCRNGSCSGTGNCTCSCSFWTGTPTCTCQTDVTPPPGGG